MLGQCSRNFRDILESKKVQFKPIKSRLDVISLLVLIRDSLFTGAASKKPIVSEQEALCKLICFKQGPNMSNSQYFKKFTELVEVLKHLGTRLGEEHKKVIPILNSMVYDPLNPTEAEQHEARKVASKCYFATMFLLHSNKKRYGSLIANLANMHTRRKDKYPTTMSDAYKYLVDFQAPTTIYNTPDEGGVVFYTEGSGRGGGAGRGSGHGGGMGGGLGTGRGGNNSHTSAGRRHGQGNSGDSGQGNSADSGTSNLTVPDQTNLAKAQGRDNNIDDNSINSESSGYSCHDCNSPECLCWCLYYQAIVYFQQNNLSPDSLAMDSASSVNIVSQKSLLHGIYKLKKEEWIPIVTVGKEMVYLKYKGYLGDYPEPVWYYPQGMANIMSLYNVKNTTG